MASVSRDWLFVAVLMILSMFCGGSEARSPFGLLFDAAEAGNGTPQLQQAVLQHLQHNADSLAGIASLLAGGGGFGNGFVAH